MFFFNFRMKLLIGTPLRYIVQLPFQRYFVGLNRSENVAAMAILLKLATQTSALVLRTHMILLHIVSVCVIFHYIKISSSNAIWIIVTKYIFWMGISDENEWKNWPNDCRNTTKIKKKVTMHDAHKFICKNILCLLLRVSSLGLKEFFSWRTSKSAICYFELQPVRDLDPTDRSRYD